MIDTTVLGIGDRGGCVALEEIAPLLTMYGYETPVTLGKLYDLARLAMELFRVPVAPWKPIAGANWNKEEGLGHLDGADDEVATCGIAPRVVGRSFEGVIGSKLLFGRERSSITVDDHAFLRGLLEEWGVHEIDPADFERIVHRTRAAVSTAGGGYLRIQEFRSITEGVLGGRLA